MKDAPVKYSVDDLAQAVSEYQHFRGKWNEANKMVEAKRKEMESFLRDEAKAKLEMDKHAANVLKIAAKVGE
jgi:hypothetical protein